MCVCVCVWGGGGGGGGQGGVVGLACTTLAVVELVGAALVNRSPHH